MTMQVPSVRSEQAARAFEKAVAAAGGTVLEDVWLGSLKGHKVRCAKGHVNSPRPNSVQQGQGICRTCGGQHPEASWKAFGDRVQELGGVVIEPAWLGKGVPHRIRCVRGHLTSPRPTSVQRGQGICRTCSKRSPEQAAREFRDRVSEMGGVVLEPSWMGVMRPHRVRCVQGHEAFPRPNALQQGQGICRTCVGNDPVDCYRRFRERLAELGAVLLESEWLGGATPHRIRCVDGHDVSVRPSGLLQGEGACRMCKGKIWDVFYIVSDASGDEIKFGITSGDPRPRLRNHARQGYQTVTLLLPSLSAGVAHQMERSVIRNLQQTAELPRRGREYYAGRVLPLVLQTVGDALSSA